MVCNDPVPPCTGATRNVRFTIDTEGNLLAPMLWSGVQVRRDEVPVPRTLRITTSAEAFEVSGQPIQVPGNAYLRSYAENGREAQGAKDLNGHGDALDTVLHVYVCGDAGSKCEWVTPRGANGRAQAADQVEVAGEVVAFLVPEGAQASDLNGDGDQNDRVLDLYLAKTGDLINVGQAAEELVMGGEPGCELVASSLPCSSSCGSRPRTGSRPRCAAP